jgi:type II secretory pathway component PulJ
MSASKSSRRSAFTLLETLVATSLSSMLFAACVSTFLYIARSQYSVVNYMQMSSQARTGLEQLSRDVRMAGNVGTFGGANLTLRVPDGSGGITGVTYTYYPDAAASPADWRGCLVRASGSANTVVFDHLTGFEFNYFNSQSVATTSAAELKQVQVRLSARHFVALAQNSFYIVSAQFTMRSKPTTH